MAIYIDYNRNGVFTDAGEKVYAAAATTSGAHTETGTFTVPTNVSYGIVRMRVICHEGVISSPTQSVSYGEYEEYSINLSPGFNSITWSDGTSTIGTGTSISTNVNTATNYAMGKINEGIQKGVNAVVSKGTDFIKDKFKADIEDLKQSKIQEFLKEFSLNLLTEKTDLTFPFLSSERLTRITCDYYTLKCLSDNAGKDPARRDFILDFAELALPRMKMENTYIAGRL